MYLFFIFLLALLFLAATAFLTAFNGAYRRLHLQDPSREPVENTFFYRPLHLYFFPHFEYESILTATLSALTLTRFLYAFMAFLILKSTASSFAKFGPYDMTRGTVSIVAVGFVAAVFIFGEYLPRILGAARAESVIKICGPVCSIFMLIVFPFTYLILKLSKSHVQAISLEQPLTKVKREIFEIIQQANVSPELNIHEKKLIEYVLRFKDRIAREVMVPRVDVFSLSAETPIKKAAKLIADEGYSRIPIYRNSVDNIVGVLMYKDILGEYMKYEQSGSDTSILDAPIETIQKNVLYTPETQKISNLLLEFRKKQVHLAIVVDEYGGTEGIVTIEDILEKIVGKIEDEYDEEEELFFPQADGSFVVDARMGILDLEVQLGILIPQEGDYDTVGGYIFHCTGTIPPRGFIIHHDEFDMEILRSDERRVERVRIKPISKSVDFEDLGSKLSQEMREE